MSKACYIFSLTLIASGLVGVRAPAAGTLAVVSAASYSAPLAGEAIASAFGANLATTTRSATSTPLPASLAGTTVSVTDSGGSTRASPLFFVSPLQVNFQVPAQTAAGPAMVTITGGDGALSTGAVQIAAVAPGLFSANSDGQGVAAAVAVQGPPGGQTASLVFACGTAPLSCTALPLNLSSAKGPIVLELYGTGIRGRSSLSRVSCTVGGTAVQVLYAGAQGSYTGLDQVNVALPTSLANRGQLNIVLTVDGQVTNTVTIDTGPPATAAADFYVSPNGNDSWSGTLPSSNAAGADGPFATLARAQQAVRGVLRNALGRTAPVVVVLRGGAYLLNQAVTLTASDSGTAAAPVIWQNYPGETPVISGGRQVAGWVPSPTAPGAWQAAVSGFQPFEQLWVSGQRRYRVRVPAASPAGYFYNLGPIYVNTATGCANSHYPKGYSPSLLISTGANAGKYECFDRFFFKAGDIDPAWSGLNDPNHPIEIIVFEDWTIARMRLASIGPSSDYLGAPANSSVAYLAGATVAGTYWGFLSGHRYLIDNVKEALSGATPGQWYVETDNSGNPRSITYVPAAGEDFSNPPTVIAPQANQLVVANDPNGVSYVKFQGLTFSHTNWIAGNPGYSTFNTSQNTARDLVPAALSFTRAGHITLESIGVSHVGGWGVEFVGTKANAAAPSGACNGQNPGNCNNQLLNSVLSDLGSGALRLGVQPANGDTDANMAQYNLIYNTVLAGGNRMLSGAAITVGNSHHNIIDHNDIYDFYNQGINLGNSLNFDGNGLPNWVHDNQITYNHIYQLGQGVTSDMGAVHTATGLQTGNVIAHNNFHDITHDPGPSGYGGWGIYFDQGSSFLSATFNLVYNTSATGFTYNHSQTGTYQLNGTPNVVANNIFAYGVQATIHRNMDDGALNFTFRNNIVYWDKTQPVPASGPPSPQNGSWSCNGLAANFTNCFAFAQNMYYTPVDPNMTAWKFLAGGKQFTLAQWQAWPSPNEDQGSTVNVDPLFLCPGAAPCAGSGPHDFHLQNGSPAPKLINFQPFDPGQAGRVSPVVTPAAVPPGFPLQLLSAYGAGMQR